MTSANLGSRRYATVDVFTEQIYEGNPVAVILDAGGLTTPQMQAIAREFNYVETTFVLPPADPSCTAHVRIFTPMREVPFAGHPNLGTAFALACQDAADGAEPRRRMTFEEAAGLVSIDIDWQSGQPAGAELTCPETLTRRGQFTATQMAACLGLAPEDIRVDGHLPEVASVGLPFAVVELATRDALRDARLDMSAYVGVLPRDGAHALYLYTQDSDEPDTDLQARMFTSFQAEDPGTGSAASAVSALLAEIRGCAELRLRIRQGVDMGRPSTLLTHVARRSGHPPVVKLGGRCVSVMFGEVRVGGRVLAARTSRE